MRERAKDQLHNWQRRVTLKCDLGYICIPTVLERRWSGWKRSSCVGQDGWVDEEREEGNCCYDKKVVEGFIYMLEER